MPSRQMKGKPTKVFTETMTNTVFTGRIGPNFKDARGVLIEVKDWLHAASLNDMACENVEIVLAEALNNVVEHACLAPDQRISVLGLIDTNTVRFQLRDGGAPYPAGEMPEGKNPDILSLPEGGFGWMLIRTLTQDLEYLRIGGKNVLSFGIALQHPAQNTSTGSQTCLKISSNRTQ